jgi:hypothetical protein
MVENAPTNQKGVILFVMVALPRHGRRAETDAYAARQIAIRKLRSFQYMILHGSESNSKGEPNNSPL